MTDEIDRNFVRITEGQVHFRSNGDLGGEERPLVLIHASPASALTLVPLIKELAGSRPLMAPDTLGNGDSCKPQMAVPDIAYYADAVGRTLDVLGIGPIDIYGSHTGGSIATELSIRQPERVRHLIIDGIGLYSKELQRDMLENYTPEITPDAFGAQFHWAWHFVRDQALFFPWYKRDTEHQRTGGLPLPGQLHAMVMEVLKSIDTYHMGYRASFRYPKRDRLALVGVPTMMIFETSDPLFQYRNEAVALVREAILGEVSGGPGAMAKAKVINDWLSCQS
jgi:pimeloyl-ACP methyl ester carboxylesterase